MTPAVLTSTTSHKKEPLLPTLEIFAKLGLLDVDINLHHILKVGVSASDALKAVAPFVAHVHLKGLENGDYCEFGVGDVDLTPVLRALIGSGYAGKFSVEYEGRFDGTLRLYQSVHRARRVVEALASPGRHAI